MKYLSEDILSRINLNLIPDRVKMAGVDSTGLKTHQKGARSRWSVVQENNLLFANKRNIIRLKTAQKDAKRMQRMDRDRDHSG